LPERKIQNINIQIPRKLVSHLGEVSTFTLWLRNENNPIDFQNIVYPSIATVGHIRHIQFT